MKHLDSRISSVKESIRECKSLIRSEANGRCSSNLLQSYIQHLVSLEETLKTLEYIKEELKEQLA